jgi:hypothetical protein
MIGPRVLPCLSPGPRGIAHAGPRWTRDRFALAIGGHHGPRAARVNAKTGHMKRPPTEAAFTSRWLAQHLAPGGWDQVAVSRQLGI